MKDAIAALTEKTEELEKEAHDLSVATNRKIDSAQKQFMILGGLLLGGLIVLIVIAVLSFSLNTDNNTILQNVESLVEYVEQSQNRGNSTNPELIEAFESIQRTEEILCLEFPEHC